MGCVFLEFSHRLSYYWVQRGLLKQRSSDFESAENYLLHAQTIRPYSYQVMHALAKNNMERGLYEYKGNNAYYANYYYDEGLRQMKDLIQNPSYSNAYSYSIHALIDMQIKFSNTSNSILSCDDCNYMTALLIKANLDNHIVLIAKKLQQYCNEHDYYEASKRISEYTEGCTNNISRDENQDYLDFSW